MQISCLLKNFLIHLRALLLCSCLCCLATAYARLCEWSMVVTLCYTSCKDVLHVYVIAPAPAADHCCACACSMCHSVYVFQWMVSLLLFLLVFSEAQPCLGAHYICSCTCKSTNTHFTCTLSSRIFCSFQCWTNLKEEAVGQNIIAYSLNYTSCTLSYTNIACWVADALAASCTLGLTPLPRFV